MVPEEGRFALALLWRAEGKRRSSVGDRKAAELAFQVVTIEQFAVTTNARVTLSSTGGILTSKGFFIEQHSVGTLTFPAIIASVVDRSLHLRAIIGRNHDLYRVNHLHAMLGKDVEAIFEGIVLYAP